MPLRIGFDMDGVLADFSLAFREVSTRLFGAGEGAPAGDPAREEDDQKRAARRADARQSKDVVVGQPESTENGGIGKGPSRDVRRRRDLVWQAIQSTPDFWLTLKPIDEGAVRRIHDLMLRHKWEVFFMTQRPQTEGDTVQRQTQLWLVQHGFELPTVLVLGGSRGAAAAALSSARRMGVRTAPSIGECLDILEKATMERAQHGFLHRLTSFIGWKD